MKPLLAVVAVVGVALAAIGVLGWWRLGAVALGVTFVLAAVLRLVLGPERVGDLAVRSRALDATVLTAVGLGLVALANTIPRGH